MKKNLLLILILLTGTWGIADALDLLKSVMPGKVSSLHEKYEGSCLECHLLGRKQFFDKCLSCHKEVKKDVALKRGYHGKNDVSRCETCHAEHQGRENGLIEFHRERFDHKQAEFQLAGKHRDVKCETCHLKHKFRETPRECYACHVKKDKHEGALGKDCERCHTSDDWKEIKFDHSKTRFLLEGKHQQVACEKCHVSDQFSSTPKVCVECHKKEDKHQGILGDRCETCHTAVAWKKILFDHDKTRFKLIGSHQETPCLKCHKTPHLKETPKVCFECHKKEDRHKGKLGRECDRCHVAEKWKRIVFDHATTKYRLIGKHLPVPCAKCHVQERYKVSSECASCHRKDDKHRGRLGDFCAQCHTEKGWKEVQKFNHQKTDFPLLGKHEPLRCSQCHKTLFFKDTSSRCDDCHKKDDYHKGTFGKKCEFCHDASDWKRSTFDHVKETGYPLIEKHSEVKCGRCHVRPLFIQRTSRACAVCHRKDDIHDGELGNRCELCHSVAGFKVIKRISFDETLPVRRRQTASRDP